MELIELRKQLDRIDKVLEEKFSERMQVVEQIRKYKKANGLPTLDTIREVQVLSKHTEMQLEELKPYIEEFFRSVMTISRQYQDRCDADLQKNANRDGADLQKNE